MIHTLIERADRVDVMFVGAHPDDLEIACGGTIAALSELGYRVGLVDLTDGEPTPNSPGPDARMAEAKAAGEVLGVAVRKVLPLPNRRLFDGFEERVLLAKEFRRYRPRLVIGFGNKTPLASPDHYQAMLITDAAIFYSRLSKWDEHFDGLPIHSIDKQLYFRLEFDRAAVPGYPNEIIMDISRTLEKKMESIRCYASQFPEHKSHVLESVRGIAIAAGTAIGVKAGEVFTSVRPLGTSDLLRSVGLA